MESIMLCLLRIGIRLIGTMLKEEEEKNIKVAIITHFAKMQQIDEFPALLNIGEDNGYSLGSQTDHDLCYVPCLSIGREK